MLSAMTAYYGHTEGFKKAQDEEMQRGLAKEQKQQWKKRG